MAMPRILPSQVVAAINSLFGPSRNELNVGMIGIAQRDNVRTLLSLLRQVPDELITVPFTDYTEYLQCQSSLTSALSVWDVGDQGPPVRNINGKDPVERIRHILAVCPDEHPPPYPDLAFISDDTARANVQQDIRAAWIDFGSHEWKGATVFAAAAVEALLFWALKCRADVERPEDLDKWRLPQYINEAERLRVIAKATADQARLATDARNFIHAGKMARTGLTCTKATALTSLAALVAVLDHLR
jgi:hypothetical protein